MTKKARKGEQLETFVIRDEEDLIVYLFDRSSTPHSTRIMEAFVLAQKEDGKDPESGEATAFLSYITAVLRDDLDGEAEERNTDFSNIPDDIRKLSKEELGSWKKVMDPNLPGALPPGIHFPRASW
jgi:hypothetical protein